MKIYCSSYLNMKHFAFFISAALFATFGLNVVASLPLRIVNGTNAEEGEFPYMVQVFTKEKFYCCGGSIIGEEWILTAAHCLELDIGYIAHGTNELYDKKIRKIEVKHAFRHPKFKVVHAITHYDIALLQLSEKIEFSERSQPVKLVESGANDPVGAWGNLSGWGKNYTDKEYPLVRLQKIKLQLLSGKECAKRINTVNHEDNFRPEHHLCTDDYWKGQCKGDSGGPFVVNGSQIGTVSWSYKPCGSSPGTYSHLSNPEYRDWIKKTANI